jgi:Dockerin type I domain
MRRRPIAARKVLLRLVALERRDVPATVNWTLGANGDFANPAAWTDGGNGTHHVPGPPDDAVIPSAFVVVSSANQTVNSISATGFQIQGGVFTIGGASNPSSLAELKVATVGALVVAGPTGGATLDVTAGFDDPHAAHIAGTLNLGQSSTLRFRRGWIYLDPGVQLLGAGQYLMNGDATGGPEVILGTNITAPTNLSLTNGLVRGTNASNALTVPTGVTTNWITTSANGATVAVPTVVQSAASLTIGGLHDETLNATLTNSGTINYQQSTGPNSSGLFLGTTGRIDNQAGATFRINPGTGTTISGALPAVINNSGTITTTGTAINNVTVNNAGVVNIQSGQLNIAGGGGTHTGLFAVSGGANLSFTAGTQTFNAPASFSGGGSVSLTSGTIVLNTPVSLPNFNLAGGAVTGAANLTLNGGGTWTAGAMQGTGSTVLPAGVVLTISGSTTKSLSGRTLNVGGTVNHTDGGLDLGTGAVIAIQPQGTYNLAADVPFSASGGTILNQGRFVKSSPNAGGGTSAINHNFTNAGTVQVNSGILFLQQNYIQNSGQTIVLPGAGLRVTTFQLNGGILGGTGPINANVTGGGTISPGTSPGALTINGNVNLSGAVVMECNGTTPGTLYDQMIVNGGVNFSGTTLSVSVGYVPGPGDGFILVVNDGTDPISGTFAGLAEGATINLAGVDFHVSYHGGDGNDVALTSLAVPPPGALTSVNDGTAQRSRVTSIQVTFSTQVTFAGPLSNAFRVSRTGPGGPTGDATVSVDLSPSTATQTIAKLSFSGPLVEFGSLIDGNYMLTVFSSQVSAGGNAFDGNLDGSPGGDLTLNFFRLYGDVTGDRTVNGLDLTAFRDAFGTVSTDAAFVAAFDFNGDGAINGTDLNQFRNRFGVILP